MKKKIMLIVPMLHQGGFERICALTAQLLKDRQEVYLVIFSDEDMIYDVSGVNLINLDLGAAPGKLGKVRNLGKRIVKLKKLKKKLAVDVSYSFGVTANIANVLSKCQDTVWTGIRGYGVLQEKSKMQLICSRSDRVVSCTKVMEEEIQAVFAPKASAALYNPCNIAEIQALSKEETDSRFTEFLERPGKLIVSMGREDDLKCFWHLIKSFFLVKKKLPDARLMIIGEGEYAEYRKLAKELSIEQDILFTGVQKNPFALLARADVYALTSKSEGFPNALIEAMVCGLPCVSVNCKTGPAEILEEDYKRCGRQDTVYEADYGLLTPIFTGDKDLNADRFTEEEQIYADELEKLLTDERLYSHYKERALKRAGDFGMESYVSKIEKLLQESR